MRRSVIVPSLLLLLASCSAQPNSTPAAASPATGQIVGTPAPGSKFSRIRIGMGKREIQDMIGEPTDQQSHTTGKIYIPFYSGPGTTEIDAHYKGEGILTYESRAVGDTSYQLIGIKVDPRESGYVR